MKVQKASSSVICSSLSSTAQKTAIRTGIKQSGVTFNCFPFKPQVAILRDLPQSPKRQSSKLKKKKKDFSSLLSFHIWTVEWVSLSRMKVQSAHCSSWHKTAQIVNQKARRPKGLRYICYFWALDNRATLWKTQPSFRVRQAWIWTQALPPTKWCWTNLSLLGPCRIYRIELSPTPQNCGEGGTLRTILTDDCTWRQTKDKYVGMPDGQIYTQ